MFERYLSTWKKYVQFSGRATRSEYWTFYLLNLVWFILIGFIFGVAVATELPIAIGLVGFVAMVFIFAQILPGLAVSIRRLHDTGRSGAWWFINFVPSVGGIVFLVFMLLDGEEGDNEYGPDPLTEGSSS